MTFPQQLNSLHAIIPAAGRSRRMGQPKLLMKIRSETVISRLLRQLKHPAILTAHVLARGDDLELQQELIRCEAEAVVPENVPAQMRESVELLLEHLESMHSPARADGWLLIPADHPIVVPSVLNSLIATWRETTDEIIVPVHDHRRGHPTIFPWSLLPRISQIPSGFGLNWLMKQKDVPVHEVEVDEPSILWDIDTPEDFERISRIAEN